MGFWGSLGKTLLTAAPYVAAPFTGGASLLAAPLANKAVSAWNQHDANNDAAKGIAPSSYDKYLNMAGGIADTAGGLGAFGGSGGTFGSGNFTGAGTGGSGASNWQKALTTGLGVAGQLSNIKNTGNQIQQATNPQQGTNPQQAQQNGIGPSGAVMPRGGYGYNQNPMNQLNQNNPNLAQSIFQGRQESIANQPFRGGYQANPLSPTGAPTTALPTAWMPPIYSSGGVGPGGMTARRPRWPQQQQQQQITDGAVGG